MTRSFPCNLFPEEGREQLVPDTLAFFVRGTPLGPISADEGRKGVW